MRNENSINKRTKLYLTTYPTAEDLRLSVLYYIEEHCKHVKEKPTKQGLRLYLDVSNDKWERWRHERTDYSLVCNWANEMLEHLSTQRLLRGGNHYAGEIFYLKNAFHWSDKHEIKTQQNSYVYVFGESDEANKALKDKRKKIIDVTPNKRSKRITSKKKPKQLTQNKSGKKEKSETSQQLSIF